MRRQTDTTPSTAFILTMRHQSTIIPLTDVCECYLPHLNLHRAKVRAAKQELPFPAFKSDRNSQKSEYFVRVNDLALWLDSAAEQAANDWRKVNE